MWRWVVLWQTSSLLLVGGTLDFRIFNQKRSYAPSSLPASPQVNCFEYSIPAKRVGRSLDKGWRLQKNAVTSSFPLPTTPTSATFSTFPTNSLFNINEISRRFDDLLPGSNDIVKEHAKLVQDINSLRQVVWVAPPPGENRDYDDSIFHEVFETSSTTTPKPTTIKPVRSTKPIPVILLGGASQRQVVTSQPLKFPHPTISLVGTSASPLAKHPYPFVMQSSIRKPIKVCMTSMPMMYTTTTRRPSLWQRILHSLIPR